MKKVTAVALVLTAAIAVWLWLSGSQRRLREVDFVRVRAETIVSTVTTNGKVEPLEFSVVRAGRDGALLRVVVERGRKVSAGQMLAELDAKDARAALEQALARVAQARSELAVFTQGGSSAALAEIQSGIEKSRVELEIARRQAASLERLVARNAATRQELAEARDSVRKLEAEIPALERKRASLVPAGGREAAEAKLAEASSAAELERQRIGESAVRAPIAGLVYNLAVRPGGFVRAGDLVAEIGQVDKLRAIIYVDEPELGKVGLGMGVRITWDGAAGREWSCNIEKLPVQIVSTGTRQVGEVLCTIDNRDGVLPPGANVSAEILSRRVDNALAIPKETLRREAAGAGVFVLAGDQVEWRAVKLGVSSITRAQVLEGLREGDAVALPTARALQPGERVAPRFP